MALVSNPWTTTVISKRLRAPDITEDYVKLVAQLHGHESQDVADCAKFLDANNVPLSSSAHTSTTVATVAPKTKSSASTDTKLAAKRPAQRSTADSIVTFVPTEDTVDPDAYEPHQELDNFGVDHLGRPLLQTDANADAVRVRLTQEGCEQTLPFSRPAGPATTGHSPQRASHTQKR
ncbi:MAG: hypothetical protein COB29_14355 [Sulfitobacter sp.]|nr:MAG: hypothetical protein COB29_14355 [Sulfitobacter sp.]